MISNDQHREVAAMLQLAHWSVLLAVRAASSGEYGPTETDESELLMGALDQLKDLRTSLDMAAPWGIYAAGSIELGAQAEVAAKAFHQSLFGAPESAEEDLEAAEEPEGAEIALLEVPEDAPSASDHPLYAEVAAILESQPTLSSYGYGTGGGALTTYDFDIQREWVLTERGLDEVAACVQWLQQNPCAEGSSYGLKHAAEERQNYLPNGAMIIAALMEGRAKPCTNCPTNQVIHRAADADCPRTRKGRRVA